MRFFALVLVTIFSPLFAQIEDVDGLMQELDLSILDDPVQSTETNIDSPANHLFINFEQLDLPETKADLIQETAQAEVFLLHFPAGNYLVAPNPGRMDEAYAQLASVIKNQNLHIRAPLKVVLHVDGNFSIALALEQDPERSLPPGVDISPLPELKFVAVMADIQLLQKEHPPVLHAFLHLQEAATRAGWEIDRREFFFFPQSPGKVLFALRVKGEKPVGKPANQE